MPNGLGYWNTWSQVGGCLGKFRKCGFVRGSMSGGWALRFQKTCPNLGEYMWFFVCGSRCKLLAAGLLACNLLPQLCHHGSRNEYDVARHLQ